MRLLLSIGFLFASACVGRISGEDPDTTAPTVVATVPDSDATHVSSAAAVTVTFSEEMNPATIDAASFRLEPAVTADVVALGAGATLTPQAPLAADTTYTATISTAVWDLAGNALEEVYVWSFSTGGTVTAGALLSWEAPTTHEDQTPLNDLGGFKIYSGTTSRTAPGFTAYDDVRDIGNYSAICSGVPLECIHYVDGFSTGAPFVTGTTVFFAVTAYDLDGNESGFSNEASKNF